MPLPTPLSWYAFHLPAWFLKLTTVFALVCEMVLPFLFFSPIRVVRLTGFVIRIFLQIGIVLTGNFNLRDNLVFSLSLSVLDDQFLIGRPRRDPSSRTAAILKQIVNVVIHGVILYGVYVLCGLSFDGSQINSNLMFTKDQFNNVVRQAIPITIFIGVASLGITIARALAMAVTEPNTYISKLTGLLVTLFYGFIALLIFTASTVPLTSLHKHTNTTVMPSVRTLFTRLERLHAVNSYNSYDHSIVTTGRYEIVLEGSNNLEGPWNEYQFFYKPGNVNHSLPFVAPYSPRLDWQFWSASQSIYMKQPWLMSLAYRLLNGQPEVLNLLDKHHSGQLAQKAPKYLRATLYTYKYTNWNQR